MQKVFHETPYQVGDIVSLSGFGKGLAIIYEVYDGTDFDGSKYQGISLLTRSGRDLGGFSWEDQEQFCSLIHRTGFNYKFENVLKLDRDFRAGVFDKYFNF